MTTAELLLKIPSGSTPIYLNASSLKILGCERAYRRTVAAGWRPRAENPIFAVGKAVHRYAELAQRNRDKDPMEYIAQAHSENPIADRQLVIGACSVHRPADIGPVLTESNGPAVEKQFAIPLETYIRDDKTYTIILTGRIDRVNWNGQMLTLIDYKTTRKWKLEDALSGYDYDIQKFFYLCVARAYAYEIFEAREVAEAAWQGRIGMQIVPVMLTTKPPRWNTNGPRWTVTDEQHEGFMRELREEIAPYIVQLHHEELTGEPSRPDGLWRNLCAKCDHKDWCWAPDDARRAMVMDTFKQEPWEPLRW